MPAGLHRREGTVSISQQTVYMTNNGFFKILIAKVNHQPKVIPDRHRAETILLLPKLFNFYTDRLAVEGDNTFTRASMFMEIYAIGVSVNNHT
jgi:hypothetical protein